jgi:hypothetical protein
LEGLAGGAALDERAKVFELCLGEGAVEVEVKVQTLKAEGVGED